MPGPREGSGFRLQTPIGSLEGRGVVAIVALVIVLLAGALTGLLYIVHQGFDGLSQAQAQTVQAVTAQHDVATAQSIEIAEWLEALVYVSLQPEHSRAEQLRRLRVPRKLQAPGMR